jgi:signal transduction histidine kinase
MRERVALVEGRLTTYREPLGGFVVEATLPYETVQVQVSEAPA